MRLTLALLATMIVSPLLATPSHADPYRWCAEYKSGRGDGGTNCYFSTMQQCQAAVSGNGGLCRENAFFDGRPVRTPEDRSINDHGMRRSRS